MRLKLNEVYLSSTTNKHFIVLEFSGEFHVKVQYLTDKDTFSNPIIWVENAARPVDKRRFNNEIKTMLNKEVKKALIKQYIKTI